VSDRSKADEVTDERDRQRVLIQITQNLATRIRNSHAFNLPTFYLPHEDDGGLPCSIPNAIEDVCEEIDKVGGWGVPAPGKHLSCLLAATPACVPGQCAGRVLLLVLDWQQHGAGVLPMSFASI
jgi:hypothetical protein